MFFILSKILWALVQPLSLATLSAFAAFLAGLLRWRKTALCAALLSFVILALSGWSTVGPVMLRPLEDHFSRPQAMPETVAGIIVLGGGFEGGINLVRGGYEVNSGGDRYIEAAILARRFPLARVVVTGGTGTLMLEGEGDGATAPRILTALGVDPSRLVMENESRNTYENALLTREMVKPQPSETWLLVTSALHMPRSVGLFRKAGFDVVPWPSDYRTAGNETFGFARDNPLDSLQATTLAIREWIGLLAYRWTGRIDEILPSK